MLLANLIKAARNQIGYAGILVSFLWLLGCGGSASTDDDGFVAASVIEVPSSANVAVPKSVETVVSTSMGLSVNWAPVSDAEHYYVYLANEAISSTFNLSNITSLPGGKQYQVTDTTFIVEDLSLDGIYHIAVSAATSIAQSFASTSVETGIYHLPTDINPEPYTEVVINEPFQVNRLQDIIHTVTDESSIVRTMLEGYELQNLYGSGLTNGRLQVTNNTPREFAEIPVIINGAAYVIKEPVKAFTVKQMVLNGIALTSATEVTVLTPNAGYNPDVSAFSSSNTVDTINVYQYIQSHLKEVYSKSETRDEFYRFLIGSEEYANTTATAIGKWFNVQTNDTDKEHRVFHSGSAGVASTAWMSINWPMNFAVQSSTYTYVYTVYSHEHAHTIGYSHSSGLAYGWDDPIHTQTKSMLDSGELPAGEIVNEKDKAYLYLNPKTNELSAYGSDASATSISNLRIIAPYYLVDHIYTQDGRIFIKSYNLNEPSERKMLVNAEILANGVSTGDLATLIVSTGSIKSDSANVFVGFASANFSSEQVNGNSGVYFLVPDGQSSVISHNADASVGWYGGRGTGSEIQVQVTHMDSGVKYPLTLSGKQGDYPMTAGLPRGSGRVTVTVSSSEGLPVGRYRGAFTIQAKGWHDATYQQNLLVEIDHLVN